MIERLEQASPTFGALAAAGEWLRDRAWIVGWWIGGRAIVFVVALVVGAVGPRGYVGAFERAHTFGLLASWDGLWYRRVAEHGYLLLPERQSNPAFFPLFPVLLRGVHALGLGYTAAGLIVANLMLLVALFAFHALTAELLGVAAARRATVYVSIFPLGYVFSMGYPESFVLAVMALAGLSALRGHWGGAALFAAAGALARPGGALVALPLLAVAWHRRRRMPPLERGLALGSVLAPVAALVSFPLYLAYALHNPWAWSEAETRWGRHFSPLGFVDAFRNVPTAFSHSAWVARDLGALAAYLLLIALARRYGAPRSWQLAGLAIVALPAFSGSFNSIARFGLLAPPIFWGLAWLGRRRRLDAAVKVASVVLLVAATATIPYAFP
jgi:hypothetical protein